MWNCVEDRIQSGEKFGRVIRKLIFEDIYADRTAVLSQNPISRITLPHLKTGDRVAFYDNCEIREGNFLCTSQKETLDAKMILSQVLSTEEELRNFCLSYKLCESNEHLFTLVIEAFLFLMRKTTNTSLNDNTHSPTHQAGLLTINRKRVLPTELDDRTVQPATRVVRQNVEIITKSPIVNARPSIKLVSPPPQPTPPPPAKLPIPPTPPKLLNASSMLSSSPNRAPPPPAPPRVQRPEEILPIQPTATIDTQKDTVEFFVPPSFDEGDDLAIMDGNQPEVKMELADDTMEVIDFGSDTEPDPIMPNPSESGTGTVSLQQPHSSNGSFSTGGIPTDVSSPRSIGTNLNYGTVESSELKLVRVEKGSRNSLIFHVLHKSSDMIGQYVMFGYVKTLD